jgi:Fe2+ or Zn2+ uptake regulation protein
VSSLTQNGNNVWFMICCYCPNQGGSVEGRDEYRVLAKAKTKGFRIRQHKSEWQGICPTCQKRGCDFPKS